MYPGEQSSLIAGSDRYSICSLSTVRDVLSRFCFAYHSCLKFDMYCKAAEKDQSSKPAKMSLMSDSDDI